MSGRSTRAKSRPTGAGGASNTARQKFFSEPPAADLPGLYPVHDGSYGVNTHVNLDSAKKSRGRKAKSGFVNEDDEDRHFTRRAKGQNDNPTEDDLRRVLEETVQEAEKDDEARDWLAGRAEVQNHRGETSNSAGVYEYDPNQGWVSRPHRVNDYRGPSVTRLGRMFPTEKESGQKPPYGHIEYRSPEQEAIINNAHPSVPPPSKNSFYGIPTGKGAAFPVTKPFAAPPRVPLTIDSSKSFTTENRLFDRADYLPPDSPPADKPTLNPSLTQAQWERVQSLAHDMRTDPREQFAISPSSIPQSLDHLTPREVRAARDLVHDMGNDERSSQKIAAELDRVAAQAEQDEQDLARGSAYPGLTYRNSTVTALPGGDEQPAMPPTRAVDPPDDEPLIVPPPDIPEYDDITPNPDSLSDASLDFPSPFGLGTDLFKRVRPSSRTSARNSSRGRPSKFDWTTLFDGPNSWASVIFVFSTVLFWVWLILTLIGGDSPRDNIFHDTGARWLTWDSFKGGIVHLIPFGSDDKSSIEVNPDITTESILQIITTKIPDQVFVEKDDGKFKITQDFWHALRNLIKEDDIILTLESVQKGAPEISNAHWLAIKSRLNREGFGPQPPSNSSSGPGVVPHDHPTCQRCWDNWVAQNGDALRGMIGGIAVTRDEFMKMFRDEIRTYQQEIRQEFAAQDARIKELVDTVTRLRDASKGLQGGLTEREVKSICDGAIRKALENFKLDALASGSIRGHANDVLINQVNFFGIGSGAVLDPHHTSKPWNPPREAYAPWSKEWWKSTGYVPQPPTSAVSPWSEEGECFCAGDTVKGVPQIINSLGVIMSRSIIPQHLVVEHILPGSTLDPRAMPKDIEVWIYIEDTTLRTEVSNFSSTNLDPPASPEPEGYVKIGHFTYEDKDHGDGIQIFKLKSELMHMHAASSQIIVRAVTNYGADHTCIYRFRLYGEVVDWRPWEPYQT
ncbi:hypothetical protein F5Y11DRAFT_133293 [Daldinia sp. FL1419]|nr:hypothetical protein F5Y11DRAFT_133293 [Daldinia sp. FL1419]